MEIWALGTAGGSRVSQVKSPMYILPVNTGVVTNQSQVSKRLCFFISGYLSISQSDTSLGIQCPETKVLNTTGPSERRDVIC